MKNLKLSYHFEFLPTIVHLSPELWKRIMGASSGGIPPRLIQVNSLAPLFHFDIKNLNFHGQFNFLGHPNLGVSAHAKIRHFSMYRCGHTRKMPWKLCTYAVVLKIVTLLKPQLWMWLKMVSKTCNTGRKPSQRLQAIPCKYCFILELFEVVISHRYFYSLRWLLVSLIHRGSIPKSEKQGNWYKEKENINLIRKENLI